MAVRGIRAPVRTAGVTAALLAATAVLAACSNHSGLRRLHATDTPASASASAVSLPSGLAGSAAGSTAAASSSASRQPKPATSHPQPSGGTTATSAAASHGTSRHTGGPTHHRPRPSTAPAPPHTPAPPTPAAAVSPGSGLHGGQQVSVSGTNFPAGERVGVQECRTGLSACVGLTARSATTGAEGGFSTSFVVSSTVQLSSCRTAGCVIRVRGSNGDVVVVPISFG